MTPAESRYAHDTLEVLGVRVDRVDPMQTMEAIAGMLGTDGCKQVVTLNPEYVMRAGREPELMRLINGSELIVPDGMGIVWASRLLGRPLKGRVTGTGLLPEIARLCAAREAGLFLLGGQPGVAEMTSAKLRHDIPGLKIAGVSSNDPGLATDERTIEAINNSGAQVLAVAYGCPKQDYWIGRNRGKLTSVRVAIGVGGAFDFISGQVPRAPKFFRRAGLEWLFRLWLEPSRARRMVALPRFGLKVLLSRKSGRA
ncbi:MAG: WecB/TagA/CpsF family glycosyltransferase [Actinobacteria bacterium]|nr:WecB/TagA/CpsF family glycosyltransferase [Actinomycetota bacterium]